MNYSKYEMLLIYPNKHKLVINYLFFWNIFSAHILDVCNREISVNKIRILKFLKYFKKVSTLKIQNIF